MIIYLWLIDEQHNPEKWLKAMLKYMNVKSETSRIPIDLHSLERWIVYKNKIIKDAKKTFRTKKLLN